MDILVPLMEVSIFCIYIYIYIYSMYVHILYHMKFKFISKVQLPVADIYITLDVTQLMVL